MAVDEQLERLSRRLSKENLGPIDMSFTDSAAPAYQRLGRTGLVNGRLRR
jgi:hypothetical protein